MAQNKLDDAVDGIAVSDLHFADENAGVTLDAVNRCTGRQAIPTNECFPHPRKDCQLSLLRENERAAGQVGIDGAKQVARRDEMRLCLRMRSQLDER